MADLVIKNNSLDTDTCISLQRGKENNNKNKYIIKNSADGYMRITPWELPAGVLKKALIMSGMSLLVGGTFDTAGAQYNSTNLSFYVNGNSLLKNLTVSGNVNVKGKFTIESTGTVDIGDYVSFIGGDVEFNKPVKIHNTTITTDGSEQIIQSKYIQFKQDLDNYVLLNRLTKDKGGDFDSYLNIKSGGKILMQVYQNGTTYIDKMTVKSSAEIINSLLIKYTNADNKQNYILIDPQTGIENASAYFVSVKVGDDSPIFSIDKSSNQLTTIKNARIQQALSIEGTNIDNNTNVLSVKGNSLFNGDIKLQAINSDKQKIVLRSNATTNQGLIEVTNTDLAVPIFRVSSTYKTTSGSFETYMRNAYVYNSLFIGYASDDAERKGSDTGTTSIRSKYIKIKNDWLDIADKKIKIENTKTKSYVQMTTNNSASTYFIVNSNSTSDTGNLFTVSKDGYTYIKDGKVAQTLQVAGVTTFSNIVNVTNNQNDTSGKRAELYLYSQNNTACDLWFSNNSNNKQMWTLSCRSASDSDVGPNSLIVHNKIKDRTYLNLKDNGEIIINPTKLTINNTEGAAIFKGELEVEGNTTVNGATDLNSTLNVAGKTTLTETEVTTFEATGNAIINGVLVTEQKSKFNDEVRIRTNNIQSDNISKGPALIINPNSESGYVIENAAGKSSEHTLQVNGTMYITGKAYFGNGINVGQDQGVVGANLPTDLSQYNPGAIFFKLI